MPDENESCWSCGADADRKDKFCRECGVEKPAGAISWDWKEQPDFGAFNAELKSFGCRIEEIETGTDQYAIRICKITK